MGGGPGSGAGAGADGGGGKGSGLVGSGEESGADVIDEAPAAKIGEDSLLRCSKSFGERVGDIFK